MTDILTAPAVVPHPREVPVWGDEEDEGDLVCVGVRDITHDIKSFFFSSVGGHVFHFDPGQFITLKLDIDGQRIDRSYTVSSSPTRPHRISITVKRQPGGIVSNWLHDNVTPGTVLTVAPPLGVFSLVHHPAPKYLFLSGGSGITPLMSMTRTLVDLGADVDVVFVHSARTPVDIVFRSELAGLPTQYPSVRVVNVCAEDAPGEVWHGHRGFLTIDLLKEIAPDLFEREVFVCGPPPYMKAIRTALADAGFDMAHHHEESFDFSTVQAAKTAEVPETTEPLVPVEPVGGEAAATDGFTISMVKSGRTFLCGPDEFILDAAFRAGISPPSSCSQGMCGTCKTVKLSGEVDMQHNGGIRPREVAAGKVLICCSKPLQDVELEL
ncbi:FAD-binding oxidoreductase [Kineococcus gynurae]|uniref:FAD-binding oxidoreductase n=1 Tax=Kineococcus gynurae TaxID=452979 RepID=A0ABV5LP43_9ACTN